MMGDGNLGRNNFLMKTNILNIMTFKRVLAKNVNFFIIFALPFAFQPTKQNKKGPAIIKNSLLSTLTAASTFGTVVMVIYSTVFTLSIL